MGSFLGFILVLFMYKYSFLCYIKSLSSSVVKGQSVKQDYLFVPVDLNTERYSLRETGLVGRTRIKGNGLALTPPLAPVHFWPLDLWESGPLAQIEPNSQRKRWPPATDLESWHCNVLPFDLPIFRSDVTITLFGAHHHSVVSSVSYHWPNSSSKQTTVSELCLIQGLRLISKLGWS